MMSFPAPEDKTPYLTAEQSARWIGIGHELFEELAAEMDWMAPTFFGTKKFYARIKVVLFAAVYALKPTPSPRKTKEKE